MKREDEKYRRSSDEPSRLLITLNEKVKFMVASIEKLIDKQDCSPCKTHELRIGFLEKGFWIIVTAITILFARVLYSLVIS